MAVQEISVEVLQNVQPILTEHPVTTDGRINLLSLLKRKKTHQVTTLHV
jgi:hypothetical protein